MPTLQHSIPVLERSIRLNLIIGKADIFIDRFMELCKPMRLVQTNIYNGNKSEFVCYIPSGRKLTNWTFYLNSDDDVIYINEKFWIEYHLPFNSIDMDEIFVYLKILILAQFNLEKVFNNPHIHFSLGDERISNKRI